MTLPTFYDGEVLEADDLNAIVASIPLFAFAAGTATIPVAGGWNYITIPNSPFTQTPLLTATVSSSAGQAGHVGLRVVGITPAQFQVHAADLTGSAPSEVRITWMAVQMTPTSAEG